MHRCLRWSTFIFILSLSFSLVSEPHKPQAEADISKKEGTAKTFNERLTSFAKGLGYTGCGIVSLILVRDALRFAYEETNRDYYRCIREDWPVPEPNDPEYILDLNVANKNASEKPFAVGTGLFLCGVIGLFNYHMKVPQNAWLHMKDAFK